MTTFTVEVQKNTAGPMAAALAQRARRPAAGLLQAGRGLSNLLKAHYRQKSQQPNKLGGDRTFFWAGEGSSVDKSVNAPKQTAPDTVSVSISHPAINQKIFGGTISAKRAKALTIPLVAAAHGRSAAVLERFLGIKLFRVKNTLAGKDASGKLTIYYALVKSVNQKPDPTALPPESEMQRVVTQAWEKWFFAEPGAA